MAPATGPALDLCVEGYQISVTKVRGLEWPPTAGLTTCAALELVSVQVTVLTPIPEGPAVGVVAVVVVCGRVVVVVPRFAELPPDVKVTSPTMSAMNRATVKMTARRRRK